MARQVRSELTRQKLLDAAVDVFGEVGYVAAGRTAIIERAGVTKGALYHHFDSMESLVRAIIESGFTTVLSTFRSMCQPTSPALEGMIHGIFAVADVLGEDKLARTSVQLAFALSEADDTAAAICTGLRAEVTAQTTRAITEGDLRDDLDADQVGESIIAAMLGAWLMSRSVGGAADRLTRLWEALLPALVAEESLPYFQEFLGREAMRHRPTADSGSGADRDQ